MPSWFWDFTAYALWVTIVVVGFIQNRRDAR